MAGRMKHCRALAAMLIAVPISLAAWAQSLPDPTRPAVDEQSVSAGDASQTSAPASSGLQTIIRRRGARPAAIVNGEYVELGGQIGGGRLSAVGENFVVLSGPGGKETLTLTPGIEKKLLKPAAVENSGKADKKLQNPARKK